MARALWRHDSKGRLAKLGAAVRAAREAKGLTIEGLAAASGVERAHVWKVEMGKRNVSVLNLAALAEGLGMTMAEMMAAAEL